MSEIEKGYNTPAAENLDRILQEQGRKKRVFAQKAGYTPQQLTDMLRHRKIMRPADIANMADLLQVDVSEFFKK